MWVTTTRIATEVFVGSRLCPVHSRGPAPACPAHRRGGSAHPACRGTVQSACSEIHNDELGTTAAAFWERASTFFDQAGIRVQAVMTDKGSCYRSKVFATALGPVKQRFTPLTGHTPLTNDPRPASAATHPHSASTTSRESTADR